MTAHLDHTSPMLLLTQLQLQFYAPMNSFSQSIPRQPIANTLAHSKPASFACDLERLSTPSPGTFQLAVSNTANQRGTHSLH
jgi:hypothetical protein